MAEKVVLGLSGGVDSAVSARLLQEQGLEVCGLFLDMGSAEARYDAIRTAEFLGVSLEIADIKDELEAKVCKAFESAYLRGETPNPCIICNPNVKFRNLIVYADGIGAKHIATGHYARVENAMLFKGQASNDQSYMLCGILASQVERLILPLGKFEKSEVRELAKAYGIPVAEKPDSMEICFIPDKDYIGWLQKRTKMPGEGAMCLDGTEIMRHNGIYRYTVGQRIPGLYNERKVYVSAIDAGKNTIELSYWDDLFKTEVRASNLNWLIEKPALPIRASVKVRHTKWECPECTVTPMPDGSVRIETDTPVRAPARGQSAAIYDGERLIGGGLIL